jgi:hypothetical protein
MWWKLDSVTTRADSVHTQITLKWETNLGDSFLFRLRKVTIVGHFYYLILPKLLHVPVVRPSSSINVLLASVTIVTLRRRNKKRLREATNTFN